jgi:hypothetical protein
MSAAESGDADAVQLAADAVEAALFLPTGCDSRLGPMCKNDLDGCRG